MMMTMKNTCQPQPQPQQPCSVVLDMTSLKHNNHNHNNHKQVYCGESNEEEHPPLDSITVTTCSSSNHQDEEEEEDNDSCCSSLTNEPSSEAQSTKQCRSIFQNYWSAQGYPQAPFYRSSVSTDIRFIAPRSSQQPAPVVESSPTTSPSHARRSIFGTVPEEAKQEDDQALLIMLAAQQQPRLMSQFRKTRSAPAMEHRSALKPSRYGTNHSATQPARGLRPTVKRCVSFNDQVRVTIVPPRSVLVEQYATQGWSNWFA